MNFRKKLLIATLAVTTTVAGTTGSALASISMGWSEYAREILLNNQSLQSGIKNVEAAYYSVLASVGAHHPKLSISAGESWTSKHQNQDNVFVTSTGVLLTHRFNITGKYQLNEQQHILGYEVGRAQFDAGLNTLMATAEETWWSAVLARENVNLQREILRQRSENHRVTMEKYKQELVPKLDIVRSEAQVVQAETLVKNAETTYQNLLANLSYLAGGLDVEPAEAVLKVPDFDVEMDYEDALRYRPDVRAARLSVERAKIVKKLTSKGLEPTLDLGVQWTPWSDPEFGTTPNSGQFGASLSLNIPILDGKQTKYGTLNADRLLQAAEANLENLKETTRRDIVVAMNNWRNAAATETDKKRQVERSEEELRITELMYAEGMGAQIDLINAQTDYQAVRTQYLDSIKNMYVALVALRRAIGDYAPDEDGNWAEAEKRYARGKNNVLGEVGLKRLRDQRSNVPELNKNSIDAALNKAGEAALEHDTDEINAKLRELNDKVDTTMTSAELDARLREISDSRESQ